MVGPEKEKTLRDGEIQINGGIGGLVGNLLIFDEATSMLKFNNNEESLPKNAKQLFQKLKDKIEKENGLTNKKLDSYRFEINVKNFPRLSLIDEKHDKSLVIEFLDKITFHTNQAKEDRVEEILKQEISEYYLQNRESFFDIKIDAIFLDVHDKVQKWWKLQKEAPYLTKSCSYFNEVKDRIINNPILNILRIIYFHKIKGSDIEFSSDSIKELKLEDFVSDPNKQILNIIAKEKLLSAVKLVQNFETANLIDLDYLYSLRIDNDYLEKAIDEFKQKGGDKDNILIIHCNDVEVKRVDELYNRLSEIMQSNSNKKVILITQEQDPLAAKFKEDSPDKYIETRDEKNSLTDLTDDSQQKLLKEGKVIFQGEEVSLGRLVDNGSKHLIDGEVLSKLINHEKVKIGKALIDSKYEDIKDYYIPRTFNRQVKIRQDFAERSEFLVTDSNKSDKLKLQEDQDEDQDIVLISDTGEGFKHLCDNHKKHNIHWLKQEGDDLIWQKSYGTLSKLKKFVDTNAQAIQEYKPEGITDIKDRVVIISAEPGMGKSTVLTPLALKTKDSLWVIRINLLDYSTALKIETEKKTKLNEAEAIKFLYRIVGFQLFQGEKEETAEKKGERKQIIESVLSVITVKDGKIGLGGYGEIIQGLNLLEIGLFNNFYNQGRIALLFDGFDEISPDYTEKVIELLQVLKNSEVEKLCIATRPYNFIQEKLENQLSIFSYSLKPLLLEEQKGFLRKFWKAKLKLSELDEQRSGVFIDELLDRLPRSIGDKDFMSIPLHASMVAEVFKDAFKSFYDSNEKELSDEHKREIEELDLVTLYERFIDIKFYKIDLGEKRPGVNTDDPYIKGIFEKEHKEFIEDHMKLALYAIFNEDEVKELLSREEMGKVSELIDEIKQGEKRTGIIEQVIDNKPKFVHRTFAEYFVASYFWESFKSVQSNKFEDFVESTIVKNLIEDDRIQISKFLQLKAKKDFESNIDFPDKQNKLRTLLTKLLDQTTQYDYNGNGKKSTKLLFGIVEFSFSTKEKSHVDVIENNDQLKLLCVSAEMGYIKLVNVLEKKLNKEFLQKYLKFDKWFYSPLWLAAKNAHLDVLEVLVKKFSYDPNWKDKDSNTLVQRIFARNEFDVLRSCLKLDIVDGKPYEDLNDRQELPIVAAFNAVAPSDVIKLLIEKTDSNLVNGFKYPESSSQIFPTQLIAVQSLKYDKEIIELAIEKSIDFSQVINLLLFEYCYESLNSPINKLNFAHHNQPSFHSDKEFLNLFERIELLLKAGVEYNHKDIQYSKTTLQYAEQIHYIHKLLYGVHKFHTQKINKSSNPLGTILKLIIDNVGSSPDFEGYKFVGSHQQEISLSLNYKDKSSEYNERIPLLPHNIPKLLFKFYEDSNVNLVENALGKFRDYITNAKEEIEAFKQYPDSKVYNKIFIGYEEMLEYYRQRKDKLKFESLDLPVKELLERVLKLYIRQDYEINDALKEVEEEVLRLKEIINKLKENSGHKKYETGEILDILAIKSIDTNEELQDLISKIYECGAIQFLSETWLHLNLIGQQRIMGILELMFKFADQSSKIFELLKKLDSGYKKLTKAIENKNYQEINNILQNVESDFIKAVINGQDDEYGSPLHYAAFKGDVQVTKILLESGANPNLKMQGSGILLSTADETQKDEDWEHDYQGCTPLHVAVFNGQLEVAKILVNCGADVNAKEERGRAPLHTAAQGGYKEILQLLLSKQADDKNGKTPLDLAQEKSSQNPQVYQEFIKILTESINQQQKTDPINQGGEVSSEECLPGPSSGNRRKREAKGECLFTWEDVDEFNEEKDEKRDLSKIKIDSEKFVSYIKDLPKGKQSQLIQLAGEAQVTGRFQGLVNKLTSNQKVISHLNRVGKISGMTMHGMMAKNVLADFLNGDYQGVAINVGFIAGGQGFAKVAEAASIKGLKLASEGKLLLGRSLRAASPFLARGTSAFVVYDLVNQVKAFKNGTEEALVGVVGDSIYLGVDAAEIGIEVAEAFEVLEGVSSVTGPIGAAIGAVVFVGTDIYMAVKRVDKIDQIIHLKGNEKFIEGLRAFIGMQPEKHIEELIEEKQLSNQLVKQGLEYLQQHSDIQRYVFPTGKSVIDSCRTIPYQTSICSNGFNWCSARRTVTRYAEKCTTKFEEDLDNTVVLDEKRADIKWSRAKPDNPSGGQLFCLSQGNYSFAPSYGSYLCKNAIGITDLSTNKTGSYTLINLGEGEDYAKGFMDSANIFVVNNGYKKYYGGNKDDVFILQGSSITGYFYGEGGVNTLDLTSFAPEEESIDVKLHIGEVKDYYQDNSFGMSGINRFLGRKAKADHVFITCDSSTSDIKFVDGQGGNEEFVDHIKIYDKDCAYEMQIVVRPNTVIYNRALKGDFHYTVPYALGSAKIDFLYSNEALNLNNTFTFEYEPIEIKNIDVKNVNALNKTSHIITFNFSPMSDKEFNITISGAENPSYRLGNNTEIKVGNKGNLYMLENTNKSVDEIIKNYLVVANRLNKMSFFIQSLLSNETVAIGSRNYEVIHNNPLHKSHLVGNGGENVYVIDFGDKKFAVDKLPEVVIYDLDVESSVDTIDLRNLVRQVRGKLSNQDHFQLKVLKSANDLLLKATVVEVEPTEDSSVSKMRKHEYCTVRLKDGVNWYNKTHVIVDNAPMKINLDNNEWSLKPLPLKFEKDKEVIIVTSQDIEENTELITPKRAGNYSFVSDHGNDLIVTNAFDVNVAKNDLCTIVLSKFYEKPKMATLSIKFADKEIILKEHQEEISTARDVNVMKKEHKDQVYNDVFNHTKSSPEVIDQPMAHKHRHSRRRQQTRHRRSENITSNGTRPSSWINDLFSWVKSSVDGLFYSRAALPEETSNTASSIPQVDEQFAKASVSNSSSTSTTLPSDGTDKKQENGGFFRVRQEKRLEDSW